MKSEKVLNDNYEIFPFHEVFYIESMLTITTTATENLIELNSALDAMYTGENLYPTRIIDYLQNIINAAAALSRYFWPPFNSKLIHKNRGQRLKEVFEIDDFSSLRNRDLRNSIEHFDENLDKYLSELTAGNIVPSYVGFRDIENASITSYFRAYYVDEHIFCVLNLEYDMKPIVEELGRIHRLLETAKDGGRFPSPSRASSLNT